MKRAPRSSGFTIVETMIVLAITGLLFVTISAAWSGRQNFYEYQSASKEMQSHIQQAVSDVRNGYFPDTGNFSCTAPAALSFGTGGQQGKNSACIFLGKALQFKVGTAYPEVIDVVTVAGKNAPGSTLVNSLPTAAPALTESFTADADLKLLHTRINGGANDTINGVAFLSDTGTSDVVSGMLESGGQSIHAYGVTGTLGTGDNFGSTNPATGVPLGAKLVSITAASGIQLCFQSQGTNNFALITIGANSSPTDVRLETKQGTGCW